MPSVKPPYETFAKIKVIGIGGSGNKAVQYMAASEIRGVQFAAVNTDAQDLHHVKVPTKLHIGKATTRGLGAGMNPELGRQAAEESREEIKDLVEDADMVFITCGLGGGTGTGAAPTVAEAARDAGALTVAIITKPFSFEGRQRGKIAQDGWEQLRRNVDAIVTIENDRILDIVDKQTSLLHAFRAVNEVLYHAVSGIAEMITVPGLINVDFADVKAVMDDAGTAHMGIGVGSGTDRMIDAAKTAMTSPLVDTSIAGAKGVLFSVVGGPGIGMQEIHEAAKHITDAVDPEAKIIFGAVIDRKMPKNQARITVLATGLSDPYPMADAEMQAQGQEDVGLHPVQPGPRALRAPEVLQGNSSTPPQGSGNGEGTQVGGNGFTQINVEDDDPWQVPAFIRRKLEAREEDKMPVKKKRKSK